MTVENIQSLSSRQMDNKISGSIETNNKSCLMTKGNGNIITLIHDLVDDNREVIINIKKPALKIMESEYIYLK